MKRVLIFTMYYWPEPTGIAPFATDLAERLAELGWQVTVVTGFPMMPTWVVPASYRGKQFMREERRGTEILRSWVYIPQRSKEGLMSAWKRVAFDSSLILTSLPNLVRHRASLIVAIGPPLQTGFAALFLKKLWRCKVLYWMQDIVPDAALNVGMMKEGFAIKMARRMESAVYRGVDRIGFISEGFRANLLSKGVPENKLSFLPDWADLERFDSVPPNPGMRRQLGLADNKFVVVHSGSMGAKQGLENVLRAVAKLPFAESIHLLFLGGGNRAEGIQAEARRLKLSNVTFLPPAGATDYVNILRTANLLLVNQLAEVVDALFPSKLLTYLPSGRPVLAAVNAQSETAKFIERSGCGVVVAANDPDALAQGILAMKRDPERSAKLGRAGAQFARANLDKPVLLARFTATLEGMI